MNRSNTAFGYICALFSGSSRYVLTLPALVVGAFLGTRVGFLCSCITHYMPHSLSGLIRQGVRDVVWTYVGGIIGVLSMAATIWVIDGVCWFRRSRSGPTSDGRKAASRTPQTDADPDFVVN